MKNLSRKRWNNRKIAFIAILIATSVSFVLIFTNFFPLTSIPSFKLSAAGLPIKLTGYIFGPIIGALTGVISDLLSFAMRPMFPHYWYTLAFAAAGLVPGVVGYLMNRRWMKKSDVDKLFEEKYNNLNFIITLFVLITIFIGLFLFIFLQKGNGVFEKQKIITNKWVFLVISTLGTLSMIIAILVFRFILKPKMFNSILPIIVFSAILEMVNTPLISLGDFGSLYAGEDNKNFIVILIGHFLLSPAKIWGNLAIILFSYKIVSPLIYNKVNNSWFKGEF